MPAADRAIAQRSAEEVERLLVEAVRRGLRQRLERVTARPPPGEEVARCQDGPSVHRTAAVAPAASARRVERKPPS